ncbi:MAG: diacylglycerol kinase family protein [Christensenellales bacterium]
MYALIINPISGNGRGKRELPRVERPRRESVPSTFVAESAEVRTYATGCEENMAGVIAVGGDGTL